ncbi:MAG TPA: response regulator [Kofleriaceae bacterium]|jgi:CheY-like chemotaxis protein|nr:response regulator [Kofleriaceae bacterium]
MTGDPRKILLVDDSALTLAVEEAILVAEGHEVRLATSVDEVVSVLESWEPDLVLTDVKMPGTDGTELCRLIKSQVHRLVPVILFSTLPDADLAVLARRCGADGYLSKSRGFDSLPAQVADLCQQILW